MNNRETPNSDGSNEAGRTWQETLKARHEQINNESDFTDSEIGRIKIYIGELIEIYKEDSLIPATKNVEGSAIHVAFIERVMQTDVATAILADFQEGYDFDTFVSTKRKRIQVFYEKVMEKMSDKKIELMSLNNFEQSGSDDQLKILTAMEETIERETGVKGSEEIVEQYQMELMILKRTHKRMYPPTKDEKKESLSEFEAIEDYHAEMKKRKEEGDAEGAVSIAKRGILKFPESGLLWMELANILAVSLKNYDEAFSAWLNAIIYNTNFVNKYLFMNLHKTSSYSEEKVEDAILKIVDDMRMLGKNEESDILLKRAMEVYEEYADKFNTPLILEDKCNALIKAGQSKNEERDHAGALSDFKTALDIATSQELVRMCEHSIQTTESVINHLESAENDTVTEEVGSSSEKRDSERLISFIRFRALPYDEMLRTLEGTKNTIEKERKIKGNEEIVKQYEEELVELEEIVRRKLAKHSLFRELSLEQQEEEIAKSRELLEGERGNPDKEMEVKKFEVELTFLVAIHQEMMSSAEAKKNLARVISEKSKIEKALEAAEKKAVDSESRVEVFKKGLDDLTEAHKEELNDAGKKMIELYERIAELKEKLEITEEELEESDNNVDRARQTALSSSPPPPDSTDGKLVTSNQELQKKVEELENQIAENEIENANFPHQIELLESEVKRLEEHIDERDRLPAPEVNAISESIKEKEALRAKIKELEKKAEEQKKAVQDASAVALEKETLAQKVEKLEKEIEEQKQFIESVSSVTGSIVVPPAPDDIASINSLNESNKLKIEQLEIELGQAETGNDTLRARVEELEKTSAELRKKLKEATGISSVPPPPKLSQRRPPVKPPVRAGSPARSSSKPPVPNGTSLPKPSVTSSSTPPPPPTAVRIPLPPLPRSARQSIAQESSVIISPAYIGDVKKAENRKAGKRVRRILRKLFTEVD